MLESDIEPRHIVFANGEGWYPHQLVHNRPAHATAFGRGNDWTLLMLVQYLVPDLGFDADRNAFFERFFDALGDISDAASDFVETAREETATQIKIRFSDEEETSHITIWEDFVGMVRYLELASADQAMLVTVRTALGKHFHFLDHTAQIAAAERDAAADPLIYYRIAYTATAEFSPKTFEAIRSGLGAQPQAVREAAAAAAGLLGWKEFLPVLVERYRAEAPGVVKRAMQDALRVFGVGA